MSVKRFKRKGLVVGLVALVIASVAAWGVFAFSIASAWAQDDGNKTEVGKSMVVAEDEEVKGNAVVTNGNLTVLGEVDGDAVVVNGKAIIEGIVHGDVTVTSGDATLGDSSRVDGNVLVVGGKVIRDPKAVVGGQINAPSASLAEGLTNNVVPPGKSGVTVSDQSAEDQTLVSGLFGSLIDLFGKGMVSLVLLVLGMGLAAIVPRRVSITSETLEAEPVPSLIVGVITGIVLFPAAGLVALLLFISIVGWLLLPVLAIGILVALLFGLVTVGAWIGRAVYDSLHHEHNGSHNHLLVQVLIGMSIILGTTFVPSILLPDSVTALMLMLLYFASCVGIASAILSRFGTLAPPKKAQYYRVAAQGGAAIYTPTAHVAAGAGHQVAETKPAPPVAEAPPTAE
jgi:hypothetical protein